MLDTLRQVQLFANLSDEQLHHLSQQGSEVWFNPGNFLFVEGEPVENFDVMLEGELQLVKRVNGKEIVLTSYQSGTFTGEIPLLASTPYIVSARALREIQLLRFRADTFEKMLLRCFPMPRTILYTMAGVSKIWQHKCNSAVLLKNQDS